MRPHGSPKTLEVRRLRAIVLLRKGHAAAEIAAKLGVDRRSVYRWQAAHLAKGIKALSAQPAPGRPPKLDDDDRARLEKLLLKGAVAAGFHTDLWTCPRIVELIHSEFGVRYHVDHIGRLLRSLGWSPQKPERRARERNEDRILGWIKNDWPRVKKTPVA